MHEVGQIKKYLRASSGPNSETRVRSIQDGGPLSPGEIDAILHLHAFSWNHDARIGDVRAIRDYFIGGGWAAFIGPGQYRSGTSQNP
jgi:hypothetical protein